MVGKRSGVEEPLPGSPEQEAEELAEEEMEEPEEAEDMCEEESTGR